MRNVKEYVTVLEVSPTGSCSLLEGLRINSQSSDHLELVGKDRWRAFDCFRGRLVLPGLRTVSLTESGVLVVLVELVVAALHQN